MSRTHFDVLQPTSLDEALGMLAAQNGQAKVLAGGTDLVPKLRAGALTTPRLVSIARVPGLDQLSFSAESGLSIGANVRLSEVGAHAEVQAHYPGLAHACSVMATTQVRNMGTVAGNLANAAPSADTAAPLLVHEAEVHLVGPDGRRQVPLEKFFTGPGATVLGPAEIIEAVVAPCPAPNTGSSYHRLSARSKVDIGAAGVAGLITLGADGRIEACRLALASVAPTPIRCPEAEAMLVGQKPEAGLLDKAAEACAAASRPIDDVRSSAAYRRHTVKVLSRRVLDDCLTRIQGSAQ
jgi:CO/xanthine dehydrogenase FAD-binding subunit